MDQPLDGPTFDVLQPGPVEVDLLLLQAEYTLAQLIAEGRLPPPPVAVLRDLSPLGR